MNFWLFVHLVAMAFFLGGQLMLAAVVVPVIRKGSDPEAMKDVARRFGIGSAVAIALLIVSGMALGSYYNIWSAPEFHIKMTLFVALLVSLGLHIKFSGSHVLMAITFVLTLGVVWTGISLPA